MLATPAAVSRAARSDEAPGAVGWPVSLGEMRRTARLPVRALARALEAADAASRPALLLAGPTIAYLARCMLDAALASRDLPEALPPGAAVPGATAPDRALLRRLARIATWNRPWRWPRAALRPGAVAISHNSLLNHRAGRREVALGFVHAESLLARARAAQAPTPETRFGNAGELCGSMLAEAEIDDGTRARMLERLAPAAAALVAAANRDLVALESTLPGKAAIWSATGGKYAARAVGLAAMARGRPVLRFDHVGTGLLVADRLGFDVVEAAVSTEVVVATEGLVRVAGNRSAAPAMPLAELSAAAGDPEFAFPLRARARPHRPRVVYATTLLRGARQYHDALLPDPVYLDWQLRLVRALARMPIDLVVKPHPATVHRDGVDPLTTVATVSTAPFEALMPEADIYLFDYGQTTTFWKGLATAQPVVYLDLGLTDFAPEVRQALDRRAVTVRVHYDQRNAPIVPTGEIADALRDAPAAEGGNHFRTLLGGTIP